MLFGFQVCLFINETDPSNAVIYDWRWLLDTLRQQNLRILHTVPPSIRGNQWELYLRKTTGDVQHHFPLDMASHSMMCGSRTSATEEKGPEAIEPSPAPPPSPHDIRSPEQPVLSVSHRPDSETQPPIARHVLHFSGTIGAREFESRCSELPWWYHSYYFDNGFSVRGDYDIGADVAGYGFPESMEGLRVLDIGTGAGWFAFYFEQRGAQVVTVDARGYCDFDVYGRATYPAIEHEQRAPDRIDEDGTPVYFSPVSRGFWIMRDMLGSRVRFRNARVYDLSPGIFDGQKFDLVFLGAILCHLRDPVGALMAVRNVCRHRVIASTPVVLGETEPDVLPRQYLPYTNIDTISWWLPNEACFRHWFGAAGFTAVDVSRQVTLRSDVLRRENGRPANGDQVLRVGSAFVP